MKIMMLAFGPVICYILVTVYAAAHSGIFGSEVLRKQGNVLTEYLIILGMYYALCLLGPTLRKFTALVVIKLGKLYK